MLSPTCPATAERKASRREAIRSSPAPFWQKLHTNDTILFISNTYEGVFMNPEQSPQPQEDQSVAPNSTPATQQPEQRKLSRREVLLLGSGAAIGGVLVGLGISQLGDESIDTATAPSGSASPDASPPGKTTSSDPETTSTPSTTPEAIPGKQIGLADEVSYDRALRVMSTFEYSRFEPQYGRAHIVDDGRGITAGIVGYCTGTTDGNKVIKRLTVKQPDNILQKKYGERLDQIDQEFADTDYSVPVGSLKGLQEPAKGLDFIKDWNSLAGDKDFQKAQIEVYEEEYFNPGVELAKKVKTKDGNGIDTAVGQLIIVDAAIQHGAGTDPDGLPALMKEAAKAAGPSPTQEEYLKALLKVRVKHLTDAENAATEKAWKKSVPRVSALNQILESNNPDLKGPLKFDVYEGDHYNEKAVA